MSSTEILGVGGPDADLISDGRRWVLVLMFVVVSVVVELVAEGSAVTLGLGLRASDFGLGTRPVEMVK